MTIGEMICARRKELGLTLEEVGQAVGVGKSTVKKWESGFIANMRRDKIAKLSKVLDVSPTVFLTSEKDTSEDKASEIEILSQSNIYSIPVYESVSAGFGVQAIDDVIDYIPVFFKHKTDADRALCICVTGDSMYPKIEEGDKIVVLMQESVDSGSVAVMLIDGEEAVVKKVVYGDDWIELHSFNPMYPVRRFNGEEVLRLRVLGLVKQVIKEL